MALIDNHTRMEAEAIDWLIRLRDASGDEWNAFTEWLEADPAHREVYSEVAAADRELQALPRPRPRAVTSFPPRSSSGSFSRRAYVACGLASMLAVGASYYALQPESGTYALHTQAGEQRVVALPDGSKIHMNGLTTIVLDRERPRYAALKTGEALFAVVHDASQPFEVAAGPSLLRDAGTVFNVVHHETRLEVAVAEGAVVFNPNRHSVDLMPGMVLLKEGSKVSVARTPADAIASWTEGRLSFSSEPIAEVVAVLSRNLPVTVRAAPDLQKRRFSGVIMLDGEPEQVVERLSALIGARARRTSDGSILISSDGATS